jgi:hypothetical protein
LAKAAPLNENLTEVCEPGSGCRQKRLRLPNHQRKKRSVPRSRRMSRLLWAAAERVACRKMRRRKKRRQMLMRRHHPVSPVGDPTHDDWRKVS